MKSQLAPLHELPDDEGAKGHVFRALGVHGVACYRQGSDAVTVDDGDRIDIREQEFSQIASRAA